MPLSSSQSKQHGRRKGIFDVLYNKRLHRLRGTCQVEVHIKNNTTYIMLTLLCWIFHIVRLLFSLKLLEGVEGSQRPHTTCFQPCEWHFSGAAEMNPLKYLFGLKNEVLRFRISKVKCQGHSDLESDIQTRFGAGIHIHAIQRWRVRF